MKTTKKSKSKQSVQIKTQCGHPHNVRNEFFNNQVSVGINSLVSDKHIYYVDIQMLKHG